MGIPLFTHTHTHTTHTLVVSFPGSTNMWRDEAMSLSMRPIMYHYCLSAACVPEVGLSPSSELLPAQNIVGSSLKILASLLTEGMSACFNYTVKQTYITLNFTQPVIITRATSLYAQQFSDGYQNMTAYVDTFTIGTSADGKHFTTYTDTTGRKVYITACNLVHCTDWCLTPLSTSFRIF